MDTEVKIVYPLGSRAQALKELERSYNDLVTVPWENLEDGQYWVARHKLLATALASYPDNAIADKLDALETLLNARTATDQGRPVPTLKSVAKG